MQYANENIADYLVRFCNNPKVNEGCNIVLITRGVQEFGMKILLPLKTNGFDLLQENEKTEADTAGEEMIYAILYLEHLDKARFSDLKKHVENDYVLNKEE